jgi:hypothetical protein
MARAHWSGRMPSGRIAIVRVSVGVCICIRYTVREREARGEHVNTQTHRHVSVSIPYGCVSVMDVYYHTSTCVCTLHGKLLHYTYPCTHAYSNAHKHAYLNLIRSNATHAFTLAFMHTYRDQKNGELVCCRPAVRLEKTPFGWLHATREFRGLKKPIRHNLGS